MNERCRNLSFRLSFWCSIALFVCLIAYFAFTLFTYRDADRAAYSRLVEAITVKEPKSKEDTTIAQQKRQGIRKEIFFKQENDRLRLSLFAVDSTLELVQLGADTEIIENLKQVRGVMQEELFYRLPDGREAFLQANGRLLLRNGDPMKVEDWVDYPIASLKPMQMVRSFEADRATYFYQDNHLVGDKVRVARYVVPGHAFIEDLKGFKPYMTGVAQSAVLNMASRTPQFKALHLKAAFYQMEEP
jgi:hypothetical protein